VSRKPRRKPKPDPSPTVFFADKYKAAIGQLESAILLWFNEADPISILVLASNALDCYHEIGKRKGKPSWLKERMEKWPRSLQERITYVQDFAKHGGMDFEDRTWFETNAAAGLIIASIESHWNIFTGWTPLMMLFWARALTEFPRWTPELRELPQIVLQSGIIQEVGRGTRRECFESFQARLEGLPGSGLSRFSLPI
jgi:hypothetical protein